jgi:hypothetical protein
MLDEERTPSPSFEPPNPTEYFNKTSKLKKNKMNRNGRIVQSMVHNDFDNRYTRTDSKLKNTIESGLKMSLSQAKEQFEMKMKQDEVGARWRGQGSVRVKTKRERTVNRNKKKMQTKSVIKTGRPRRKQVVRAVQKKVIYGSI